MKKLLLCSLVVLLSASLAAQELALASAQTEKPLSIRKAVLFSALVPGGGEIYAHSYNKGAFFIGVEVAILFGYWRLNQERQWKIDSYQDYAYTYCDVPTGSSDEVYRRLQSYYSSDEFNDRVIQDARNYFLIYKNDPESYHAYVDANIYSGDKTWQWDSEAHWKEFQKLRGEKQDLEIYAKFALGAALVNRIISIIDAAKTTRSFNETILNGKFSVIPDWRNKGFFLNYEYRF